MFPRGKIILLLTFLVSASSLFGQSPTNAAPSFSDPTAVLTHVTLSGNHGAYVAPFATLSATNPALSGSQARTESYVYVTNGPTVSVINAATNVVVATIPAQGLGVAVSPDGAHVYVAGGGDGTVSVIATASNTVIATIPTAGVGPVAVAITPDGAHAYVIGFSSSSSFPRTGIVSVVDTATNTVVTTIPVGSLHPSAVAITPDGAHAYVIGFPTSNPLIIGIVSVIDTASNTVVATIPVGNDLTAVAITPDGAHAYVTDLANNTVWVINTATNTVMDSPIVVGNYPGAVAITLDGAHAYVVNLLDSSLSVIATASNTVIATFPYSEVSTTFPGERSITGIAISPDGTRVYVAVTDGNSVSVVDTASNTVVAMIKVEGPVGVAFAPLTPPQAADVSAIVTVTRSGYVLNPVTRRYTQTVTVTNNSANTITGPLSLVLDNLTDAALFNETGTTDGLELPARSPYLNANVNLAAGQHTSLTLQFTDPSHAAISYNTRVLAGPGAR
jgi:YVTN family beta-propeller protein